MTQAELGRLIGESQTTIAYWEQSEKPPRSDALPRLADALGVGMEEIVGESGRPVKGRGPPGKLHYLFEEVAKLPRRQRERVLGVLAALVKEYGRNGG